jgi:hypothetical protein
VPGLSGKNFRRLFEILSTAWKELWLSGENYFHCLEIIPDICLEFFPLPAREYHLAASHSVVPIQPLPRYF